MLRDQSEARNHDRPSSRAWRLLASFTLLSLTVGVATLRGPARAGGDDAKPDISAKTPVQAALEPISPPYVPEGSAGLFAFRPAATFRRSGMAEAINTLADEMGLFEVVKEYHVNAFTPGALKLGFEDVEWVTCGIGFGRGKNAEGDNYHSMMFSGLTIRTIAPFDWLTFLRQWRLELTEVREGGRSYYRITGRMQPMIGPHPCVCVLDGRTVVMDEEEGIRRLISNAAPAQPAFLQSPDWDRASRSLLAVGFDNQDGKFAKLYDLGRPDDAVVLSAFKGLGHWVFNLDDSATLTFRASAVVQDADAGRVAMKVVESLSKLGKDWVEHADPDSMADIANVRAYPMFKAFLDGLVVKGSDRSIDVHANGFGTLADLASLMIADARESKVALEKKQSVKR